MVGVGVRVGQVGGLVMETGDYRARKCILHVKTFIYQMDTSGGGAKLLPPRPSLSFLLLIPALCLAF